MRGQGRLQRNIAGIWRVFDRVLDGGALFSSILVWFLCAAVTAQVIARFWVKRPLPVTELSAWTMLYICFLIAGWVLRGEGHVTMDFVIQRFSKNTQALVRSISSIFCTILYLVITVYGVEVTWDAWQTRAFVGESILEPPVFILLLIIPIGTFVLALQFLRKSLRDWAGRRVLPQATSDHDVTAVIKGEEAL